MAKSTKRESIKVNENKELEKTREIHYKDIQDRLDNEKKLEENITIEEKKGNVVLTALKVIFLLISLIICFLFIAYKVYKSRDAIDLTYVIVNYGIFSLFCTSFIGTVLFIKTKARNILGIFTTLLLVIFASFNILVEANIINLPRQGIIPDFTGKSINDALLFAAQNNIEVTQTNEYSDNILDMHIITQDVKPNTLIKKVKKINFTVSNGPDYSKEVLVNDMVGLTIDDLVKFINNNHLNNVTIDYSINNDIKKDTIISQSYKGDMKRSDAITFVISLGKKEDLKPVSIDDFTNKSLFEATLWLKKNGINYKVDYEFSDTVKKGSIVKQTPASKTTVDPNKDTVIIVVSKGKKIVAPNLVAMDIDKIVEWVVENNLKLKYNEEYNSYAKEGDVIGSSVLEGDTVEEGTVITITTSKGQLKFPSFNSLAEFKSWANNYGIKYKEEHEYSDTVKAGDIISLSIKTGANVIFEDTITVKISYGKSVSVPSFIGMNKGSISSKCYSVGLNCTFFYTGYSNIPADQAVSQSVNSGNKVISGTYVSIGLSNGPAKSFSVYIQETWFSAGNTAGTISTLKSKLATEAPGVNFNIIGKASNSGTVGYIHPDSPIHGGQNTFTQGNTYTIWIIQ